MFRAQETALIPQGMSLPQLQVLTLLARERRPLMISELARWMVEEPASLTGLVDRVEAKGWVRTHGDPKDRRKRLVEFTKEGVKKFEEASAVANKASEKPFSVLTPAETKQLKTYCQKVADAAASLSGKPGPRAQ
jgi:DNA-binding MarR family transcriptional regulator